MSTPQTHSDLGNSVYDYGYSDNWISSEPGPIEEIMSYSAFYSQSYFTIPVTTSCDLLPLISEPVTSPATVRHAMSVIKVITDKSNPTQPPVIMGDQPV